MVALNSAAAFVSPGLANDFTEGAERAVDAIDSGRATEKLDRLVVLTQGCRPFIRDEC